MADSAWQQLKTDVRSHTNIDITIVPGFYQATATQNFFSNRNSLVSSSRPCAVIVAFGSLKV